MGVQFEGALRSSRTAEALAHRVIDRVPALADRLVLMIHSENPSYREADVVPDQDLWRSCHDNLARILQLVTATSEVGTADGTEDYYDAARATGRRRAHQGLPLDDVLRSFRFGGRLVWDALTEEAGREGEPDGELLLQIGNRVWEVIDSTSAEVGSAYHAVQRNAVRAAERRRSLVWDGLLSGTTDSSFLFETSRVLGLPVDDAYLVVVGEATSRDTGGAHRFEELLRADGVRSAWHTRGAELLGLVALPSTDQGTRERVLASLRARCDARAGVHGPVDGLAQVARGAQQADLALRTLGPHDTLATLDERLPEALLLQAPELSELLVARWLGPLLGLTRTEREPLLETLDAWVRTSGSAGQTAAVVRCHRNTVLNRLRRLQELIDPPGHDLTEGAVPLELALALRAHRVARRP